jgi:hypothetical protein
LFALKRASLLRIYRRLLVVIDRQLWRLSN